MLKGLDGSYATVAQSESAKVPFSANTLSAIYLAKHEMFKASPLNSRPCHPSGPRGLGPPSKPRSLNPQARKYIHH